MSYLTGWNYRTWDLTRDVILLRDLQNNNNIFRIYYILALTLTCSDFFFPTCSYFFPTLCPRSFSQPPIVPKVSHEGDTSNFEAYPEDEWKKETPVSPKDLEIFKNFWEWKSKNPSSSAGTVSGTDPGGRAEMVIRWLLTENVANICPSGLPTIKCGEKEVLFMICDSLSLLFLCKKKNPTHQNIGV